MQGRKLLLVPPLHYSAIFYHILVSIIISSFNSRRCSFGVNSGAKLIFGTFDLPGKAAVLNFKNFNGQYSCTVCYHPGAHQPNGARVFLPYRYPDQSQAEVDSAAQKTEADHCVVKGVLGKSLSEMLDIVDCVPIDYMHCCLEGIVRSLMKRWFTPSYHDNPYYLGLHWANIDVMLLKQSPLLSLANRLDPLNTCNMGRLLNYTIGYCFTRCRCCLTIYLLCIFTIMHCLFVGCTSS